MRDVNSIKKRDSFDVRIVRYEYIHSIKDEYFDELVRIANPQSNENILDVGCGYGSVTREILKRRKDLRLNCFLADSNQTQLFRAKEELSHIGFNHKTELNFFIDNLIDSKFKENTFDTIIAKMVIHEIPFLKQQQAINNAYRILKPGGKLIIWDMVLDANTQKIIQDFIRIKDNLAGFKTLEKNRYFLRFDEIESLLATANFGKTKKEYAIDSPVITHKRLEQEFNNDILKLNKWHELIRQKIKYLDESILKQIQFKDNQESISFVPHKAIISAIK